jgi:hypothetical protein
MALIGPKLPRYSDYGQLFAVSDKNGAFAGCDKDSAILAVVDVNIGSNIENKITAIFAVVDVVLLLLDGVDFLDLKGICLILEAVVVRIVLFLYCFWLQNVGVKLGWLFYRFGWGFFWLH